MTLIIGSKVDTRRAHYTIWVSLTHNFDINGETQTAYTIDTWYGDEILIEKLARMLKVYQTLSQEDLADYTIIESKMLEIADQVGTYDRDPERLLEAFMDAIPRNVFDFHTRAQVSKFEIYWYNDNGEKHNVKMSD